LEAARDAVEKSNQGEGFPKFETAVQRGVSANLCEAAASLIERGNGLDISVTWAYTRLTPEKRRRVIFASPDAGILREAARLFRNREPRSDETLEGYIIRLARDEDEQEGFATLRTLIEARQSSVRIALPKQLYEQAAEAHKKQIAISIKGDLVREGQRWRLDNARELAILPAEDEGE
jgi:hypothetical protein